MKWLKQLKPWQRWGIVFGCVYLGSTLAAFLLLKALGVQGEGWSVFIVFLLPSFLIARIIPTDFGHLVNVFIFVSLILFNAVFYSAIGALVGFIVGSRSIGVRI